MAAQGRSQSQATLMMALFVIVGSPVAYYIWHNLSDLLAGKVRPVQLGITAVLMVVGWFLARNVLGRFVQSLPGSDG